jgi:pyruvate/2-oxoglutarate dehydrogenase complex dihydrolipoamide dehydrogenase (E3) component
MLDEPDTCFGPSALLRNKPKRCHPEAAQRLKDPPGDAPRGVKVSQRSALGGAPRRLTSECFLVATGSKPFQPPNIPFDDEDVDDSDTVLQIDRLPKTMTVLGGGSSAASTRRCSRRCT